MKILLLFLISSLSLATSTSWPEGYLRLDKIKDFEENLKSDFSFVTLTQYGLSKEKNSLTSIVFKSRSSTPKKILITAGTHGDELITVEILKQYATFLASQYDKFNFFDTVELHFILVVNPDGYSKRSRFANGIDPNRNHPYPGNDKRTLNPCVEYIDKYILSNNFIGVLDLHAFGRYIMYPWSFTEESLPSADHLLFDTLAKKMAAKNKYTTGSLSKTLYGSRGSSSDYYYWKQGKIYPFVIEMGGSFTPDKKDFESYFTEVEPSITTFIQEVSKAKLPNGVEKIEEEKNVLRFSLGRDYMMSLARANAGQTDPARLLKDAQQDIGDKLSSPVRIYLDSWREIEEAFTKQKTEIAITTLSEAKNILNTNKNVEVLMVGKEDDSSYRCNIIGLKKDFELLGKDILKKKKLILPRYIQPICIKYAEILYEQLSIPMETIDFAYTTVSWVEAYKKMFDDRDSLILTTSESIKNLDHILGSYYIKNSTVVKTSDNLFASDKIILARKNLDSILSKKVKKILSEIKYPDNVKLRVENFIEPNKEFWDSIDLLPKEYLLSEE